jgi:hypothetical protein
MLDRSLGFFSGTIPLVADSVSIAEWMTVPGLGMGLAPLRENCHEENSRQSSGKDTCAISGLGSRGARHTILDGVLAAVCLRPVGRAADSERVPPSQRELVTRIRKSAACAAGVYTIQPSSLALSFIFSLRAVSPTRHLPPASRPLWTRIFFPPSLLFSQSFFHACRCL